MYVYYTLVFIASIFYFILFYIRIFVVRKTTMINCAFVMFVSIIPTLPNVYTHLNNKIEADLIDLAISKSITPYKIALRSYCFKQEALSGNSDVWLFVQIYESSLDRELFSTHSYFSELSGMKLLMNNN